MTGGAGVMFAAMGALGLAPTAGAAPAFQPPRAADFRLSGRVPASVVVLGGGVAGLVAAYELGKAGYRCTVLEPRDRVGGRNFTARAGTTQTDLSGTTQTASFADGQYMNCGPARLAQWMVTLDYCRELRVPIEIFPNTNADAYIYNERDGMEPGKPVRFRTVRSDVHGYVSELLAKASARGALDMELSGEDREQLLAFLEEWGSIGGEYDYTGGSQRGYSAYPGAAGDPGRPLHPVPDVSAVFSSAVGRYLSFESEFDQAMVMFQPVGGMDRIPQALAGAIGADRIRTRCAATSVRQEANGVLVTYTDSSAQQRELRADYCVCAMPPHILAQLPHNLGPEVQRALTSVSPAPASKLGLEYRSRWWETEHRIYGGITWTDLDLRQIWHPASGFHGDRGVLIGYYNFARNAAKYDAMTPQQRVDRAVMLGERIYGPKYRTELVSAFSQSWMTTPYIEGAWHDLPEDTPDAAVLKPVARPTGRVLFAGDWLSYVDAWQHGAILSARAAVTALHGRALSR